MAAPAPIPTLPITSATAAQSAHIASLTTQLHQLVEKNNVFSAKLEVALKEGRERVNEEVRRSDEVVRLMRRAHLEEMEGVKKRMETLRISAIHAQHSIAYAHQVTKTDLLLTEQALARQKRQNALQSVALVRAGGAERLLQLRLTTAKTSHAIQQQALLAQLERSRADILAARTRGAAQDDKTVAKLKNQLETLRASLSMTQDTVQALQGEKGKIDMELAESQAVLEELRHEMREERRVRKERERELGLVKEELSAKDTTDTLNATRDAESAKAQKRRVKELEVALAAEKGRVVELEGEKAELEGEKLESEKERRRIEKRLERVLATPTNTNTTATASALKVSSTTDKKKDAEKNMDGPPKSKKRPRDEEGSDDDEGGLVIQGAFGLPDRSAPPKKHKKAKLDDSDTEQSKPLKPSKPKPSKPTAAASTTASSKPTTTSSKPTTISSKPKKAPTAKSSAPPLPPSSPPHPSPSPISTPQFSDEEEEDASVAVVKAVKNPAKAPVVGAKAKKPTAAEQTATAKKFKAPPKTWDNEEEEEEAGNDSDDFAAKKAKFFGGSMTDDAKGKKKVAAEEKEVGKKASSSSVAVVKAKEKVKSKSATRAGDDSDDNGREVFDLGAVSDTSDGEDLEELVKKPKVKQVEAGGKTKSQSKPRATSKAPTESEGSKAPVKKATTAAAASKGKDKGDKGKTVVEVENAPAPAPAVTKPKKRTFNLLGSTTNNALAGAGLNAFGSWGGGMNENIYNIPSQLSSPEKGSGLVPRAKFGN